MSRSGIAVVAIVAAVVVGGGGWAWNSGLLAAASAAAGGQATPSSVPAAVKTTPVARRTIQVTADLDGTLGYEGTAAVAAGHPGTVTWLPALGSIIRRGQPTVELDGRRTGYLMYGGRPMWRPLRSGIDDGPDIRQLEANLKALGFGHSVKVDNHWTSATTSAVKRWQRSVGLDDDGIIDLGDVVFLPRALRVTEHAVGLGTPVGPGTPILNGTTTWRVVTVQLDADRQDLVAPNSRVTVELPDGSTTGGHISKIGRVAQASDDNAGPGGASPPTIEVTIGLDDTSAVGSLDQAPVTVHVVTNAHENVLAVPVDALVALLEGGYAVEVQAADGSRRYVRVTPGLFQDGWVEVTGDGLAAGDKVVEPS
jgi:peptidoglycan hydrolase-like protein with peptidoglycan-binding domain